LYDYHVISIRGKIIKSVNKPNPCKKRDSREHLFEQLVVDQHFIPMITKKIGADTNRKI